jgi:hypothetical protein
MTFFVSAHFFITKMKNEKLNHFILNKEKCYVQMTRGQFHQRSTGSFYSSRLTPIQLAHGIERKS